MRSMKKNQYVTEKHLAIIGNKINRLDCEFLNTIKRKMDYKSPYFFVCFAEAVNTALNEGYKLMENLTMSELVNELNKKALYLYKNSNISSAFAGLTTMV